MDAWKAALPLALTSMGVLEMRLKAFSGGD
jgi:hypothetical protein